MKEDIKINRKINNLKSLNLLISNDINAIKISEVLKSVDSIKYRGGEILWDLRNKLAIGSIEVLNNINRKGPDWQINFTKEVFCFIWIIWIPRKKRNNENIITLIFMNNLLVPHSGMFEMSVLKRHLGNLWL